MTIDFDNDLRRVFARAADRAPETTPEWSSEPRVSVVSEGPKRTNRPTTARVLAVGMAAAASVALVVVMSNRADPAADAPQSPPAVLQPSANPDRIDSYPIIDWKGPDVLYGYRSVRTEDQGWGGSIGVVDATGTPSVLVAIAAFPVGWVTFPDAQTGRVAGVGETRFDGGVTLSWSVGDIPFTMVGDDLDLMYQLIEHIEPIAGGTDRGGYRFVGGLPGGLSELEAPQHRVPMRTPSVNTEGVRGVLSMSVEDGPILATLAGGGVLKPQSITINGLHGYRSTTGRPVIVLAPATDETLWLSSETMTFEELQGVAERVQLVDEATFRAKYNVTD
jgi:hypothetical protein